MTKHSSCPYPGPDFPDKGSLLFDGDKVWCAACILRCYMGSINDNDLSTRTRKSYIGRMKRMREALAKFILTNEITRISPRMRGILKHEGYLAYERHVFNTELEIIKHGREHYVTPEGVIFLGDTKMSEIAVEKIKIEERKARRSIR